MTAKLSTVPVRPGNVVLAANREIGVVARVIGRVVSVDSGTKFQSNFDISQVIRLPYDDLGDYVLAGLS